MSSFVFDTGALSLFYAEDPRLRPIVDGIDAGHDSGFLSSVTLSEFHCRTCRSLGKDTADLWSRQLGERLQATPPGLELSLAAGLEKCRNGALSLADAHALALSKSVNGTLLTTDSGLARGRDVRVRFLKA